MTSMIVLHNGFLSRGYCHCRAANRFPTDIEDVWALRIANPRNRGSITASLGACRPLLDEQAPQMINPHAIEFAAPRATSQSLEVSLRAQDTPSTQMIPRIGNASMKTFVYNIWNFVFNHEASPLKHIPDVATRHYVLQTLALMWALAFAVAIGSYTVFALSVLGHAVLIAAAAITVATYSTAAIKPQMFARFASRRPDGEHE